MTDITVVIPCSPAHLQLLPRALASVRAQTAPCKTVVIMDDQLKGAGHARNRGLEQVATPLVCFLDADDWIKPTFAERTLALHKRTGRYVYTDYEFSDKPGEVVKAPDCAWMNKTHHIITTLLPTAWARAVGGFDETLTAVEDAEFYAHLITSNYCGIRLPEPLFVYYVPPDKQSRSANAFYDGRQHQIENLIRERYRGKEVMCCGQEKKPDPPLEPAPEGMVYVLRTEGGKSNVRGAVTGKLYGRFGNDRPFLMHPVDAQAQPGKFTILEVAAPQPPPAHIIDEQAEWDKFGQAFARTLQPEPAPPPPYVPEPAPVAPSKPDFHKLARVAANVHRGTGKPIFVFPDKEYQSYTDVRTLVRLSGYEATTMSEAQKRYPDSSIPYIFLSPEQPFAVPYTNLRLIWWSLEYGGVYEPDLTKWGGEVWASDPTWAAAHNAKYVLMGSHPGVNSDPLSDSYADDKHYDVLMLAYMTHRRQAIKDQLVDLRTPDEIYPGYGMERHIQLLRSRLMLHVHQNEGVAAVPPQRFALAAAYKLPVVSEWIPNSEFGGSVSFALYDELADLARDQLARDDLAASGQFLHEYLCIENTFAKTVEAALHE